MRLQVSATKLQVLGVRGIAFLLLGVWACVGAQGQAPQPPPKDLTSTSIEDLMNVEVTSVSKKEQKLSRTAAAIFVITQEDIRRSGATNIPDLLRMVPGLDVEQINGSTWAVDTGLTWKPWERFSVSIVGQNLLRDHHQEFEDVFGSLQSGQVKRSAYAKMAWQF